MAVTYTWEVTSLKIKNEGDLEKCVVQTYWKKIGTDENGVEGSFSGATPFTTEGMDPSAFTAYEDLTEETVLGWIQAVVIEGYEEHVNGQIQKQIDEQINVISEPALPWATPAEE